MKVCVIGAGAIGGFLGIRLATCAEVELSVVARGSTLTALRDRGWRLQQAGEELHVKVRAVDDASALGPQDLVIVAVKAPALASAASSIAPLLSAETIVLPAMNGVPWWFAQGVSELGPEPLHSVDPEGAITRAIPLRHVIGCVVHASAAVAEPGLVRHHRGQGLIIGEAAGGRSERAQALADLLLRAGFELTHSDNVRRDIWYKLWGNMTMNPVSVLTGATIDRVLADPLVRGFCSAVMQEAAAIGARIGCPIDETPADRHAVTAKLGAFKTSMLQDAQAGRPIELDAIVTAVQELGQRLGIATPNIDTLLGLTRLHARVHGLYPDEPPQR